MDQKRLLKIILAVLSVVLVGLMACFLLSKETSSVVQQTAPQVIAEPTQTKTSESKMTQAVPINDKISDWKIYQNKEYGFEFKYPKDWSAPQLTVGDFPNDSEYPNLGEASFWRLTLWTKNIDTCVEGDCYEIRLNGYKARNVSAAEKVLQGEALVTEFTKEEIPGGFIFEYSQDSTCFFWDALMVGKTQTIKLTSHCGGEDPVLSDVFYQFLKTFKLTK